MTNTDIYRTKAQIQHVVDHCEIPPVILEGILAEVLSTVRARSIQDLAIDTDELRHIAADQQKQIDELKAKYEPKQKEADAENGDSE